MPPLRSSSVRSKAWLRGMSFWSPNPMTFTMTNHRKKNTFSCLFPSQHSFLCQFMASTGPGFQTHCPFIKMKPSYPPLACTYDMLLFFPLEEWQSCWVNQSPSATEQEAERGKWQWQEDFKHGWMTGCKKGVMWEKLQEDQMRGRPGQGLDFPWKHNKDSFLK